MIDGEKVKYSKTYKFNISKTYNVQFQLYTDINMDYMFQNISSLISVELISKKKAKIKSMISSFDNCFNLESFNIDGFDLQQIKSFHKCN